MVVFYVHNYTSSQFLRTFGLSHLLGAYPACIRSLCRWTPSGTAGRQAAATAVPGRVHSGMRVVGCMPRLSMHRALIDLLCSQGLMGVFTFLHRCVHRAMICLALFYKYLYVHLYTHAAHQLYDYFVDPPYVYNHTEITTSRFHLQSSGLHACVVSSTTQGGIAGVGMQPGILKLPPRIGGGACPSVANAKRSKTRRRKYESYCCCCCCCCCSVLCRCVCCVV